MTGAGSRGAAVALLVVSALLGFAAAAQPATGLAVLALATVPAVFAVPPAGRLWLGLVVGVIGCAVALLGGLAGDAAAWAAVAALATAGVVIATRGRSWATLGERYGGASEASQPDDPHQLWRALDRGEDPTAADTSDPGDPMGGLDDGRVD